MLCIKNECMIILSIKIFHTFKKLNLVVNEKKNYLTSLQQLEFLVQFNESLFEAVVLFCQGLIFFLCLTHLVHFRRGVDVCTGADELS